MVKNINIVLNKLYYWMLVISLMLFISSCVHEPLNGPIDPGDGTDTTMTNIPCDENIIYFELDVLPILVSNCAFSGCHNSGTAADGIILSSYASVMASDVVRANRPSNSDLYEVITEDDPDDVMPPPPRPKLSNEQIATIRKWIEQGAKNEQCNDTACDLGEMSYNQHIKPILANRCVGCHGAVAPSGGITLHTYEGVRIVAMNNRLVGSIDHQLGYRPMPEGGAKLDTCMIRQVKLWIEQGSKNN